MGVTHEMGLWNHNNLKNICLILVSSIEDRFMVLSHQVLVKTHISQKSL